MNYIPRIVLLCAALAMVWLPGCAGSDTKDKSPPGKEGTVAAREITLTLKVPGSKLYPERHRVAKLWIDGKDYTTNLAIEKDAEAFPEKEVTISKLPIKKDQKTLTIKYGFWTNNYTNFIRTKVVSLDSAEALKVDITEEDPKHKDHIEPIYVPTPNAVVKKMLELAKVGKDDVVWDIGCGDGRMVIMAVEEFGAKKGLGIDINPERIADSNKNLKKSTVADRVTFKLGNALELKDVSEASVVLLYMGEDLNLRLRPVLQKTLKPGSRVVSHRFKMGDWQPDQSIKVVEDGEDYHLHLWIIKEPKSK